ncbi:MAG: hypothetical protein HRU15_11455 [Planctomycetes bacterium]|nr:hypothetical protein [Planctomycetota bacterium]
MIALYQWLRQHAGVLVAFCVGLMALAGIAIFILAFQECRFDPAPGSMWEYQLQTNVYGIEEDGALGKLRGSSKRQLDMICLSEDNDVALIASGTSGHNEISMLKISPKGQVSRFLDDELLSNSGKSIGHFFDFNLFPLPQGLEQSWTVPMVYSILPANKNQVFATVRRVQNGSHPTFQMTFPTVAWLKDGPKTPYSQISDFTCTYVFDVHRGLVESAKVNFLFAQESRRSLKAYQRRVTMDLTLKSFAHLKDDVSAVWKQLDAATGVQRQINVGDKGKARDLIRKINNDSVHLPPALDKFVKNLASEVQYKVADDTGEQSAVSNDNTPLENTSNAVQYAIQVASVSRHRRSKADEEVARLKRDGFKATLGRKGESLIICIGPYAAKDQRVLDTFTQRYPRNKPFWIAVRR